MSGPIRKYVSSDLKAELTCPECGKTRPTDVAKFMQMSLNAQVKLKCRCACGHRFEVILERRRSIRKNFMLSGWMRHNRTKKKIKITDLSRHGMRVRFLEKTRLKTGQTVAVQFNMDDPMKSPVSRDVRVKNTLSPTEYGCEFMTFEHRGNLGKYFLFYF